MTTGVAGVGDQVVRHYSYGHPHAGDGRFGGVKANTGHIPTAPAAPNSGTVCRHTQGAQWCGLGICSEPLCTLQVLHDKCRAVGIEEFVCKPFRVQDLQRVLCKTPTTSTMLS